MKLWGILGWKSMLTARALGKPSRMTCYLLMYPTWNMLNVSARVPEFFGRSPCCSHWRQSRTSDSLPLVPLTGNINHYTGCSTDICRWWDSLQSLLMLLTTELGAGTSSTSESNPWLHWAEVDLLPESSWGLPALRKQSIGTFTLSRHDILISGVLQVALCLAQLHLPERRWTKASLLFNDWDVCRKTTTLY